MNNIIKSKMSKNLFNILKIPSYITTIIILLQVMLVWLNGCGPKLNVSVSEELVGHVRERNNGFFTHYWIGYVIKDSINKLYYIELNGKRFGPYIGVNQYFQISPDEKHIATAVRTNEKEYIILDGKVQWSHKNLNWEWGWQSNGTSSSLSWFVSLVFSATGSKLAYKIQIDDQKETVCVNGEPGPSFQSISEMGFIDDNIIYTAWSSKGVSVIFGDMVLGPYDKKWQTKLSANKKHFSFIAKTGERYSLIVDGKEKEIIGIGDCAVGPSGEVAYTYLTTWGWKIFSIDQSLPQVFSAIKHNSLTFSPDGRHIAFWGCIKDEWSLFIDTLVYNGFDGYYEYKLNGMDYSVMWSFDSKHIAYYARSEKNFIISLDGKKVPMPKDPYPGLVTEMFEDNKGNTVGINITGKPHFNQGVFVQCLQERERIKTSHYNAILFRSKLAYVDSSENGKFMVIGSKREGPYQNIKSILYSSPDNKHYAYVVTSDSGEIVILDGKPMKFNYHSILSSSFISNNEFLHLGLKDTFLYRVRYSLSQAN